MAPLDEQTRILVISTNPLITDSIAIAFKEEQDFTLLDNSLLHEGVIPVIQKTLPEIILLDYQYQVDKVYELVDGIASQFPSSAVIVILPESEIQNSNSLILAGARAFLSAPFTQRNLLSTLRRVRELLSRLQVSAQPSADFGSFAQSGNTFVVFSPKGGTGVSTLATNLAIAIRQQLKQQEILLVDGKHMFGHVALMLNLRTANSMIDLVSHAGTLDVNLIRQVVVPHVSGIHVLPCPNVISEAQGIRPDDLYKVVIALKKVYPNIIIDAGNFLNENAVTYMDSADRILMVLTPNLASIRDGRQFLDLTRTLSYPPEKILLLLNQLGHRTDVKMDEIEKVLRVKVFGKIPVDENVLISSLNEGIPIVQSKPNHPVSKAIKKIAKSLLDTVSSSNALQLAASTKRVPSEILAQTSRLG
jgi:pilus assembly protein CpaE